MTDNNSRSLHAFVGAKALVAQDEDQESCTPFRPLDFIFLSLNAVEIKRLKSRPARETILESWDLQVHRFSDQD